MYFLFLVFEEKRHSQQWLFNIKYNYICYCSNQMIPLCTYRLFCISVITGMLSLKFKVVFNITFLNILLQWSQLSFGWSCDLDFFNPAPAGTPKLLQKWLPQPQHQGQAKWLVLLGCNWLDPPSPWGNELILPPLLLSIKRTERKKFRNWKQFHEFLPECTNMCVCNWHLHCSLQCH